MLSQKQKSFYIYINICDELSMNLILHKFHVFNSYLAKSWYGKRRFIKHKIQQQNNQAMESIICDIK